MKKIVQFLKFILVGISNTIVSEGVYVLIVCLGGHYAFATFLGFSLSILNAYYWGNKYVFRENSEEPARVWWRVLFKTYIAYSLGLVLDILLLFVWIDLLQIGTYMEGIAEWVQSMGIQNADAHIIGEIVAKAMNVLLITPFNFLMNKYWAYRTKR